MIWLLVTPTRLRSLKPGPGGCEALGVNSRCMLVARSVSVYLLCASSRTCVAHWVWVCRLEPESGGLAAYIGIMCAAY